MTNRKRCFQGTSIIETGLSDHHCLIVSCLKSHFKKLAPKKLIYRDKKKFNEEAYLDDLRGIDFVDVCSGENAYMKNCQNKFVKLLTSMLLSKLNFKVQ